MSLPFPNVLHAELLKTRRSYGLLVALGGPFVFTSIFVLYVLFHPEKSVDINWGNFGRMHVQLYFLLYPIFAALIGFLLTNVEHKNRGFKQLFTFPAPKLYFYFSKVLILLFWLACSIGFAVLLLYLGAGLLELVFEKTGFQEIVLPEALWSFFINLFFALLSLVAIHFFLSIYFDNFIISVGSACFLVIAGMVIGSTTWEYKHLFPYSYGHLLIMQYFAGNTTLFFKEIWISLAYSVVFFAAGYVLMARKEIK